MSALPAALIPFRNRIFLAYWLTGLSANFGWLIQMVGASWLMTSLGGTAEMVALVQTTVALPVMMFSLLAGTLADTFGRRAVVLWSQSFLLMVSVALAWAAWHGAVTPVSLLVFTFLIGCGKALNNPAWQTYITEFMPREELPQAIALNSVGFNLARSMGPAIGGAIVAVVGAFAAFLVNALSNVGMIVMLLRQKRPVAGAKDLPPEPTFRAMGAGVRYVAMSPHLLLVMLRSAVFNLTAISVMALMPLIARDLLGGGPQTYGFLLGAFGVGAVLGALSTGALRRQVPIETRARGGFVAFAVATAMIALSTNFALTMLGMVLAGANWLVTLNAFNSMIQTDSPRWVVGRSVAVYMTAAFAGNAGGSWLWGALAGAYGTPASLLVSAGCLVVGAALGFLLPIRELHGQNLDPHGGWVAPTLRIDIQPRSGPIVTTVEYSIREEDVPAFLAAMVERRRSRFRDGVWRWSLERDIEHPDLWTERYETPTWVDNQRHHQRRTISDMEVAARIRAMHQADHPPRVRHYIDRQPGRSHSEQPILPDHVH